MPVRIIIDHPLEKLILQVHSKGFGRKRLAKQITVHESMTSSKNTKLESVNKVFNNCSLLNFNARSLSNKLDLLNAIIKTNFNKFYFYFLIVAQRVAQNTN